MQLIDGIVYGIIISFAAYFTVLSFRLKTPSPLWFSLYILCFGIAWSLFNPTRLDLLQVASSDIIFSMKIFFTGLMYFFGIKFIRDFFTIKGFSKKLDLSMQGIQWMGLVFIPVNLMHPPVTFLLNCILVIFSPVFSSAVAIFLCIRGNPPLKYATVGWIFLQTASAILLIHGFNLLPASPVIHFALPVLFFLAILCCGIAILKQHDENSKYAFIDNLTGMANRRLFEQVLAIEWNRNLRKQLPLSVIIASIDNFRSFQKSYGKTQAHKSIQSIAAAFDKNLQRAGDLAARYVNDIFIAVLPDTTAHEATFLSEKIRETVEKLAIRHERSDTGKTLTISLGVCTAVPKMDKDSTDIVITADKALFQAKTQGGNRVVSIDQTRDSLYHARQA